jgi:hypothetical protein
LAHLALPKWANWAIWQGIGKNSTIAFTAMRKHLLSLWVMVLLGGTTPGTCLAQDVLADALALGRIEQGLQLMYGYDFGGARQQFQPVQDQYPNHPTSPLLDALMIYWQHQPFADLKGAAYTQYLQLLEKTVNLAEVRLAKNEDDIEGVFFKLVACGLLTQHYNDAGESLKAVGETKRLYSLIKQSFELRKKNVELYFMTGLYNYYREYYPQVHPFYRPAAVFFKSGSKKDGLADLELAAQKSIFSAPESANYLAHIYLRYEKNQPLALAHVRNLGRKFPNNLHYIGNLTETLLLTRHYDEALPYAQQLQASPRAFRQAVGKVFGAMVAELHQKNFEQAAKAYHEAERMLKKEGKYAHPYLMYAYAGLHRHYTRLGDKVRAGQYRQLARQYDTYNYLGEAF